MTKYTKLVTDLIGEKSPGPRVSLYVPERADFAAAKLFLALRETAIRLLESSGEKTLTEEFRTWSLKAWDGLERGHSASTTAMFFSRDLRLALPLSGEVPPRVIVAKSFHIKPLLFFRSREMAGDLLLFTESGIERHSSRGEDLSLTARFPAPLETELPDIHWPRKLGKEKLRIFLQDIAAKIPRDHFVQISGAPEGFCRNPKTWAPIIETPFFDRNFSPLPSASIVRAQFLARLNLHRLSNLQQTMNEGLRGPGATADPIEILNRLRDNRIRKLFVSLEALRWGIVSEDSGKVTYHLKQSDHEDDDVLDDLTELALRQGVEVQIVKQTELPGRLEAFAF